MADEGIFIIQQGLLADADQGPYTGEIHGPATPFGKRLGTVLAIVIGTLAFVGPAPILEVSGSEPLIGLSFRQPIPAVFFASVGGVTTLFSVIGAIAYPNRRPQEAMKYAEGGKISGYQSDFAVGLLMPTVVFAIALVLFDAVFPVLYDAIGAGELVRAGAIFLTVIFVFAIAYALSWITVLVLGIVSLPLVIPAFVGAYFGGFVRRIADIGPDFLAATRESTDRNEEW